MEGVPFSLRASTALDSDIDSTGPRRYQGSRPSPTACSGCSSVQTVFDTSHPDGGRVIPEHQRNATLYRLGRSMRAHGVGFAAILAALNEINRTQCQPPLERQEVEGIAEGVVTQPDREDFTPPSDTVDEGPRVFIGAEIASAVVTRPDWIVEGVFSARHQHLIVGIAGSAKSMVLEDAALSISHPGIATFLGLPIRRHARVALESWENGQEEDLRRLHKLAHGHGLDVRTVFDQLILIANDTHSLTDEAYFAKRSAEIRAWGVSVYCLDALSDAAAFDLRENEPYRVWWRTRIAALLHAGVTVIMTHQTGHSGAGPQPRDRAVRDATQIRALSTHVLAMRGGAAPYTIVHNKHRNSTQQTFGPLTLEGRMDDPYIRLTLGDVVPRPTGMKTKAALATRLLHRLGQSQPSGTPFDRAAIEDFLNDPARPASQRVSARVWEPVLDTMTNARTFKQGPARGQGGADVWFYQRKARK